jgi:alginate O-acetyltransferase complex protein AlgJ
MQIFRDVYDGEHHVFDALFRHIKLYSAQYVLRFCAIVLTCSLGVWGFPWLLNRAPQQTIDIGIADNYPGSRSWQIEYTAQQLPFRWVPSEVSIPIATWSPFMLLHTHTWMHQDVETATFKVGRLRVPLDTQSFRAPRVVHLLLAPESSPRITARMETTGSAPRWAFTTLQLRPTHPWHMQPHIIGAWLIIWAGMAIISMRWWPTQWHWGICVSSLVTTLTLSHIAPLGSVIGDILQMTTLAWLVAGIGFIGVLCWWAPDYLKWMRQTARVPRFVISGYLLITIIPLSVTFFQQEFDPWAIAENRRLAPWPTWQDPVHYSAAAEAWIMDHIGMRSLMIRAKNELDYQLLRSSRRVYFGKDDYLFLRRWNDERLPALTHILQDPQQRTTLARQITEQVAWYEAQGLTCYVIIAPSKEFIYPEYLPWYITPPSYQQMVNFEAELRQNGVRIVPTYDILQTTKPLVPQLYYPQDFHWNRIAAYYVGQYILADLQKYRPSNMVKLPTITISAGPTPVHDRTFAALLTEHLSYPPSFEGRIDLPIERSKITNPGANLITYPADMPVMYPQQSLLIVGDSFSARLHDAGFAGGFSSVYRTGRPRDRTAFATWLKNTNITTIVWQLRDMSLPLYLADQEEK